MAWTYDGTLDTNLEKVRLLIGDIDSTDQQLTDAEINYFLELATTVTAAAIMSVEALVAKYARQVDRSVGDLSLSASRRTTAYRELLGTLRERESQGALPWAGGVYVADKQTNEDDTSLVEPAFSREAFRNQRSTDSSDAQTDTRYD